MMRRIFFLTTLIAASNFTAVSQTPTPAPPVQAEEAPVLTVPKDYRYSSRGRRDPFVNPVPKPRAVQVAPPSARPPGLRGVLVAEAQIAGVVTSKEPSMNVVVISAPGARTPYVARVGDQLYDAVIRNITLESVTFSVTGPAGEARTPREIVRLVRPKPGESK